MLTEDQREIINQQDASLDRIANTVGNIKNNASLINEEIKIHIMKLDDCEKNVDTNISKLGTVNKKLKSIYENSSKCDKIIYGVLIFIIVILVIVLITILSI